MCLIVAIPYATIGIVEYPVMAVMSGLAQPALMDTNTTLCIEPGGDFAAPRTSSRYLVCGDDVVVVVRCGGNCVHVFVLAWCVG